MRLEFEVIVVVNAMKKLPQKVVSVLSFERLNNPLITWLGLTSGGWRQVDNVDMCQTLDLRMGRTILSITNKT
jgi:hypothetical protein